MKLLYAYWKRYWHCLYFGIIRMKTEDHRMSTEKIYGTTAKVGCACGKNYFQRNFLDIYNDTHGTSWKVEEWNERYKDLHS